MNARPASHTRTATAIVARDIVKRYGATHALDHVSFSVAEGEALALWGPNGAGKTTILRCLLGLARFDGTIEIFGIDPRREGQRARSLIGFVPQELPSSSSTVDEIARYYGSLKRVAPAASVAALERLGLLEHRDKPVAALSGGLKQRLAVALALAGAPRLLLLDEPTASLDAVSRAELLQLLASLRDEGMSIVFSSHRPEDVISLANQVLHIVRGQVAGLLDPRQYRDRIGAASRLVVTLSNGHMPEALGVLREMGYDAVGDRHVLTVPIAPADKAKVVHALIDQGVAIDDFELERN